MSYLVLARKYRPRDFESVVGQEGLVEVLRGAIRDDRVGHAYLFCGPRGTGKTTTARIFAKALNCVEGPTETPCGVCEHCVDADAGTSVDLIEIDAASHTGVDNVRTLREEAAYAPMSARYKVYLIDEVHMLSKPAINALLKTLEEPPAHVKFLFATTEPQKLLDTVLSRCQILRLSPISEDKIAARLDFVFGAEQLTPEEGVALELARLARGGMRDALSMADQLIALAGTSPTRADVGRLGGEGGLKELDALLSLVEASDRAGVLDALPAREGGEREYLGRILAHLRQALVVSLCGAKSPLVEASPEERGVMAARAERLGTDRLQVWLEELLAARERMKALPGQARLVLEVALLDLARPGGDMPLAELAARLAGLEGRLAAGAPPSARAESGAPPGAVGAAPIAAEAPRTLTPTQRPPSQPAPEAPRRPSMLRRDTSPDAAPPPPAAAPPEPASAAPGRAKEPQVIWSEALASFAERNGEAARLLRRVARLVELDGRVARVAVKPVPDGDRQLLSDRRVQTSLARALGQASGQELELHLAFGEDQTRAPETPPDEFVDEVARVFGGTIERS